MPYGAGIGLGIGLTLGYTPERILGLTIATAAISTTLQIFVIKFLLYLLIRSPGASKRNDK